MPSAGEIRHQIQTEAQQRTRLAVPAFGGGILYLLSAIIVSQTLGGAPSVGLLQGLTPAVSGVASPSLSPRAEEVKFISRHAFGLIAGSALASLSLIVLMLVLLLLVQATRFRRPTMWQGALPLVLYGGIAVAVVSVGHEIVSAIETHSFAVGHDHSSHAVDQALTKGAANVIVDYVDLLAGLAFAAGIVTTMLNAQRVGLLPRWMGILGMVTGLLIFLPVGGAELQVIPAFWMVMTGILFMGKWPGGDPPAWAAGEARPWPSRRPPRQPAAAAAGASGGEGVPEPVRPVQAGTSRKRRKRPQG